MTSTNNKLALVCGAGGFIGSHLVKRLKREGYWVRGVDLKYPEYNPTAADDFVIGDLRDPNVCSNVVDRPFDRSTSLAAGKLTAQPFDELYQLAADMGGAGYIFSGEHDADVMHNSGTINLNMGYIAQRKGIKKVFYSSSACVYPARNLTDPDHPVTLEESAYPAAPDSEYGWEKLFSERMYFSYKRNYGLDVHIARFHNTFGPEGTWKGGREKAPAAICRKVASTPDGGTIEIWGDGKQTRSFTYIDETVEGVRRLMNSDFAGPVNIGSDVLVSINQLVEMAMEIAGKKLHVNHIPGPVGIRGRNCDNRLINEKLGWSPSRPLREGMEKMYEWVKEQVEKDKKR